MPTINLVQTLNDKEKRIYDLLCENKSNQEIASEVGFSTNGVVYHLKNIYAKLGVSSKSKADLHLCRQRAISYGGTKIVQVIEQVSEKTVKSKIEEYSKEEILSALKKLTWYDSVRATEIIEDLLKVLETGNDYYKMINGVSKKEFTGGIGGGGIDKHLLKTGY